MLVTLEDVKVVLSLQDQIRFNGYERDQCTHVEHRKNGHRPLALVEAEDEVFTNTLVVYFGLVAAVVDRWLEVRDRVDVDME